MNIIKIFLLLCCLTPFLWNSSVLAADQQVTTKKSANLINSTNATVNLNVGILNGQARELVYDVDTGKKISELIWRLENVPMVGLSGSIDLPWRMKLNISGWIKASEARAEMDDYDWSPEKYGDDWSDHSRTDTKLTRGELFDINLGVLIFKTNDFKAFGVVGFTHDHWRWQDGAGTYTYSINGFRDAHGTFPDIVGITYEQWFYAPYVGLQLHYQYKDLSIAGRLNGSRWTWAEDEDHHVSRDLVFRDSFKNIPFLMAGVDVSYPVSTNLSLKASLDYKRFYHTIGNTSVSGADSGYFHDGAGIELFWWMVSIGAVYAF